jgi:XRE family transcriptional regulator, regulator of sulfur utilization
MEVIKDRRAELKLTYRELAARTGLSPQALRNIELGINSPTLDSLRKISKGLGVPIEALIEEEPGGPMKRA